MTQLPLEIMEKIINQLPVDQVSADNWDLIRHNLQVKYFITDPIIYDKGHFYDRNIPTGQPFTISSEFDVRYKELTILPNTYVTDLQLIDGLPKINLQHVKTLRTSLQLDYRLFPSLQTIIYQGGVKITEFPSVKRIGIEFRDPKKIFKAVQYDQPFPPFPSCLEEISITCELRVPITNLPSGLKRLSIQAFHFDQMTLPENLNFLEIRCIGSFFNPDMIPKNIKSLVLHSGNKDGDLFISGLYQLQHLIVVGLPFPEYPIIYVTDLPSLKNLRIAGALRYIVDLQALKSSGQMNSSSDKIFKIDRGKHVCL